MTITFHCPNCAGTCAFHDRFAGRRARCMVCQQLFIIPSEDGQKAEEVELKLVNENPVPGFYEAVFLKSGKIFTDRRNLTGLIFVLAAVCFKFFAGHAACLLGLIVKISAWGCLFWYYMEIILSTAFDEEQLPRSEIGGLSGFIGNVIKSVCLFILVLILTELPFVIITQILQKVGIQSQLLLHGIIFAGFFVFPIAILTLSVTRDITMLIRFDYLIKPIVRAFWPYLTCAVLVLAAAILQSSAYEYGQLQEGVSLIWVVVHLIANIAYALLAIIAMRSVGLFYRHYSCCLPW